MAVEWKDSTSYSQRDTERKPSWWEAKVGKFRISVGNVYRGCPGWFMHCEPFFDAHEIEGAKDEKDAKKKALNLLKGILKDALKEIK